MEENKITKKPNYFKYTFITLFIIFISLYFMNIIGYYDVNRNKTLLTEEKIKEFENDIKNGEYIDLNNYLEEENRDYNNNFSNISLQLSNGIDIFLNKGLKNTIKALEKLFK